MDLKIIILTWLVLEELQTADVTNLKRIIHVEILSKSDSICGERNIVDDLS